MSHLDEGTLHALLDGELESSEMLEIQAHLGSCPACGVRLREAKDFLATTDRLVGTVQMPAGHSRPAAPSAAAVGRESVPNRERRPPPRDFQPPTDSPPVLLIPDTPDSGEFRRRFARGLGWAATVVVVAGAGYLASGLGGSRSSPLPPGPAIRDTAGAVLTPEEAGRPLQDSKAPAANTPRTEVRKAPAPPAAPAPKDLAKVAPPPADTQDSAPVVEDTDTVAPAAEDTVSVAESTPSRDSTEELALRRERAAAATAELDRQHRLARAAAATAALDAAARANRVQAQRPRAAAAESAGNAADALQQAATPPAPRTLEQRSGIYLRIGLDEAARQLAGPVHVIEGLSPQFMGLAQGRVWPEADPTRPVVRVVYQDQQGRMILLDQQRVRGGQATEGRWIVGDVALQLSGEAPQEVLRNLRARVR